MISARVAAAAAMGCAASASLAQTGPSVSVGRITSAQACTVYTMSEGRSAAVATPYVYAAASSWRTWLVKDCVDNFAGIRAAMESALAASGGVALRGQNGRFVVTGRLSDVSGGPGEAPPEARPTNGGFSIATSGMRVVMDVTVRDGAGRIVFGAPIVKTIETGSDVRVDGFRASSSESGEALYGRLQQEVALAAARAIAFHFTPLRVTGVEAGTVQLNYGAPLLKLGTIVQVIGARGQVARFNVVAADGNGAVARLDNGADITGLPPGTPASVIEADDPAVNARRFEKVDLP